MCLQQAKLGLAESQFCADSLLGLSVQVKTSNRVLLSRRHTHQYRKHILIIVAVITPLARMPLRVKNHAEISHIELILVVNIRLTINDDLCLNDSPN